VALTKRVGRLNHWRKRHGRRNKTTNYTFCLRRKGPILVYVAMVSTLFTSQRSAPDKSQPDYTTLASCRGCNLQGHTIGVGHYRAVQNLSSEICQHTHRVVMPRRQTQHIDPNFHMNKQQTFTRKRLQAQTAAARNNSESCHVN